MTLPAFRTWGRLLFACFVMVLAHQAVAADAPWPQAVDLASVEDEFPLAGELMLFDDPSHSLDAGAVLRQSNWQAATPRTLSRGFTRSAVWIAGTFVNRGRQPVTRWLAVDPVRLEDVAFYVVDDAGAAAEERYRSGIGAPLAARPIDSTQIGFPVTLAPGEQMRYLVRVQSRSALLLSLQIWHPSAFQDAQYEETIVHMLLAGAMLAIAVISTVLAVVWRDRIFVLLTAAIVAEVVYELAFEGFLYALFLRQGGDWVLRLPSVAGSISVALFTLLILWFLGFERLRAWRWIFVAMIAVQVGAAAWTAFGDYRTGAALGVQGVFLCNLIWIASIVDGVRRGIPNARLFLLAFLPDCATLFVRLATLAGIASPEWNAGTSHVWDSIGALVLLSLVIGGRSRQLVLKQHHTQRALLAEREATREKLDQAVTTRTRELREALVRADDAVRVKTDFLARISHDLRTPLTSIIGFADLIQADGREDAERGRIIRRSAAHMLGMVNDLIDYANGRDADALSPQPAYTYAMLDTVSQHGAALAARGGNTFSVDIVGDLPPVIELDDRRMQQVLGNLLDNAAKFTERGTIRLTVTGHVVDAALRRWNLRFSIADSGCGIASADQARVFEPFVRALQDDHRPGIGLGLSIVNLWATRMGATLHLDSVPGEGTTVVMELLVSEMDEAAISNLRMHEPAAALPQIEGRGHRVLVAEDTAEIRELLRDDLLSLDFDVEVYGDGTSAVHRLSSPDGEPFSLVVTDLLMPGASGQAVLHAARGRHPHVPVIMMSAVPAHKPTAGEHFDAYLQKPVSLADLRNTIAALLNLPRADQLSISAAVDVEMLKLPSKSLQDEARMLAELGAVSDLLDWTDKAAALEPACAPFVAKVRQLAKRGELDELQSMFSAGVPAAGAAL
ncbi:7TM-DISM domain-containing protein [Cupriavidus basilensis]|uniref:7TM-DISM domain-containing protein n=1 Tax=Cupriavidus basilensis TaxID=68895 RepID=UPI0020A6663E|nr:ATP-binding protein [Cupriavidus basilensis]